MILTCPACSARFKVPDNAIGPGGRRVKCSKCAHQWHCMPEVQLVEAALPPPEPEPEIEEIAADESPPKPRSQQDLLRAKAAEAKAALAKPVIPRPQMPKPARVKKQKLKPGNIPGISMSQGIGLRSIFFGVIAIIAMIYLGVLTFTPSFFGIEDSEPLALADVVLKRTSTDNTNQRFTSSVERYNLQGVVYSTAAMKTCRSPSYVWCCWTATARK
jgi:predicted Zn finger-like uncharacterized protein